MSFEDIVQEVKKQGEESRAKEKQRAEKQSKKDSDDIEKLNETLKTSSENEIEIIKRIDRLQKNRLKAKTKEDKEKADKALQTQQSVLKDVRSEIKKSTDGIENIKKAAIKREEDASKDKTVRDAQLKFFGRSEKQQQKLDAQKQSIDDQKEALNRLIRLQKKQGIDVTRSAQVLKAQQKIQREEKRFEKKNRLGLLRRTKQEALFRLTQLELGRRSLRGILRSPIIIGKGLKDLTVGLAKGIGGVLGGAAGGAKSLFGFIMNALKKVVIFGFLPTLIAFLDSDLFKTLKTFIIERGIPAFQQFASFFQDSIIPFLEKIYEENIKPIVGFLFDSLVKQFQIFGDAFKGIGEAIDLFKEGDILGGIKKIIGTLFTFLKDTLDNLLTGIFNIIGNIFGIESLENTDSAFDLVKDAFLSLVDRIQKYFFGILDGIKTTIKDIVFQVTGGLFGEEDPEKVLQRRKEDLQKLEEKNAGIRERIQKGIDSKRERISKLDLDTARGRRLAAKEEKQILAEEKKLAKLDAAESEKKLEIAKLENATRLETTPPSQVENATRLATTPPSQGRPEAMQQAALNKSAPIVTTPPIIVDNSKISTTDTTNVSSAQSYTSNPDPLTNQALAQPA